MSTAEKVIPYVPPAPAALRIVQSPGCVLAFPAFGGKIDAPFASSMISAYSHANCIHHIDMLLGDSLVNRARNKLAMNFLGGFPGEDEKGEKVKIQCDWLLFIDTDLIFQWQDVRKLYDIACKMGPDVYCGTYPIKQLKPKIVFNQLAGHVPDAEGMVQVRESGTGFMLIHRNVFMKMIDKFSDEIRYEADAGNMNQAREIQYDFFSVGVRTDMEYKYKRFLSEDWFFCQRWREIGGKVWLNTLIQCQHIGQISYPISTKDIFEVAKIHSEALQVLKKQQEEQAGRGTPPLSAPVMPEVYRPPVAAAP